MKDVLEGLGIKETNEFRGDIEGSEELQDEESILRSSTGEFREPIVAHDAFHRVFINKVRKEPKYHFSQAVAWFLTNDRKLPVYDRAARKGKPCLPFCITGDQWVQVNRPLLTRTTNQTEYQESLYALLTRPFIRSMLPVSPMEKAYGEVLGRLARYKQMNPQLALNITADKHFMVTVASETDEQKIEEKIDSAIVDIANQLQKERETLTKSIEEKDLTLKELEGRVSAVEGELRERETEHEKQNEELSGKLKGERSRRGIAEGEVENLKELLGTFKANVIRWSGFVGGLILTSFILWLTLVKLAPLETFKNTLIMGGLSQLVLIFAFLHIPLRQHWKWLIGVIVTLIIAILTMQFFAT